MQRFKIKMVLTTLCEINLGDSIIAGDVARNEANWSDEAISNAISERLLRFARNDKPRVFYYSGKYELRIIMWY